MQMVKKMVIAIVLFWLAFLLFMPKVHLYYLMEKVAVRQGVKINESAIEEKPFGLSLSGVQVYYRGIPLVKIEKADLMTLLLYNRLEATRFAFDALVKEKFPASLERVVVSYSVIDPLRIHISGVGSFGVFTGKYDLRSRKVHIDIVPSKQIGAVAKLFHKGKKGYYYEASF